MADIAALCQGYAPPVIRVRLFAGLRERAGWSSRELDGVARVGDVWAALGLGDAARRSALRGQQGVRRRPSASSPTATRWR